MALECAIVIFDIHSFIVYILIAELGILNHILIIKILDLKIWTTK